MENNDMGSRQTRQKRPSEAIFASARANLLIACVLTAVNIVLIFANADISFMFSMYAPQLLGALGFYVMDLGYQTQGMIYLIGAVAIVGLAFLFWALSKKHNWFIVAALVLFVADTAFMFYNIIDYAAFIFDIIFHAWVLYYLITGTIAYFKMRKLKKEHEAHCVGGHDPSAHMAPGSYQPNVGMGQNEYYAGEYENQGAYQQPHQYDPIYDKAPGVKQQRGFSSDEYFDSAQDSAHIIDYSSHVVDINAPRDEDN